MDLFEDNEQIFNLFDNDVPDSKPKNQPAKQKKKNPKATYITQMQSALKSPFKCKNHTTENLRVRGQLSSAVTCGSCGFKCMGKSGFLSCPKTAVCFHLCTICKVCPKNHVLRNCLSLKQYQDKDVLHGQNKFKCGGCEVVQEVGSEGVMHCGPCSYSACMKCVNQLNQYWEKEQQKACQKQQQNK